MPYEKGHLENKSPYDASARTRFYVSTVNNFADF